MGASLQLHAPCERLVPVLFVPTITDKRIAFHVDMKAIRHNVDIHRFSSPGMGKVKFKYTPGQS